MGGLPSPIKRDFWPWHIWRLLWPILTLLATWAGTTLTQTNNDFVKDIAMVNSSLGRQLLTTLTPQIPSLKRTAKAHENPHIFPGKYHQNDGFSSQRFVSLQECNNIIYRRCTVEKPAPDETKILDFVPRYDWLGYRNLHRWWKKQLEKLDTKNATTPI